MPKKHLFLFLTPGKVAGCPLFVQFHKGRKVAGNFVQISSEGGAVPVFGEEEMNSKKKAPRLEPAFQGSGIIVSLGGVDGTKKGMLEDYVKSLVG